MPGTLNLGADRFTPYVCDFIFSGIDLTDAVMKSQVRARRDGGALLADLDTVVTPATEGLYLVSVGAIDSITTSAVTMYIDEATMAAMPYGTEQGDDFLAYWDFQITPDDGVKQVYLRGTFTVRAGVTE